MQAAVEAGLGQPARERARPLRGTADARTVVRGATRERTPARGPRGVPDLVTKWFPTGSNLSEVRRDMLRQQQGSRSASTIDCKEVGMKRWACLVGLAVCLCPGWEAQAACSLPLSDGGGPVLRNPEVSVTFWGSYWTKTNPAPNPTSGAQLGAVQYILNGPYLSKVNRYHNGRTSTRPSRRGT